MDGQGWEVCAQRHGGAPFWMWVKGWKVYDQQPGTDHIIENPLARLKHPDGNIYPKLTKSYKKKAKTS